MGTDVLSDSALEVLFAAVRLAKSEQIQSVKILRARLAQFFPGQEADITSALSYCGARERRTRSAC